MGDPAPKFEEPDASRVRRLEVYYSVLDSDPDFIAELRQLHRQLNLTWVGQGAYSNEPIPDAVTNFAARWRLPRRHGIDDVMETLLDAAFLQSIDWSDVYPSAEATIQKQLPSEYPRKLFISPLAYCPDFEPSSMNSRLLVIAQRNLDWTISVSTTFEYDPSVHSRKWLETYVTQTIADLRSSIMQQAELLESKAEAAGYRSQGPRHRNRRTLWRMATRLYRAAVLGMSNKEIHRKEGLEAPDDDKNGGASTPRAVGKSIERWAEVLDIPLPPR